MTLGECRLNACVPIRALNERLTVEHARSRQQRSHVLPGKAAAREMDQM